MKNTPEQDKAKYWKTSVTACGLLLLTAGGMYWFATRGEYSLTLYQLAVLLTYPAGVLIISALFSVFSMLLSRPRKARAKREKKPVKQWPVIRLFFRGRKRKADEAKAEEPDYGEVPADSGGPVELELTRAEEAAEAPDTAPAEYPDGLRAIRRREAEEETKKKADRAHVILSVVYVLFQAALAGGFLYYSFMIVYPMTEGYFEFTFLHAAVMLIAAGAMLVAGKLMAPGEEEGSRTASDIMKICGVLMLASAVAVVLRVMFGLNSQRAFYWIYRVFGALLVLDLALALVLAGIRGQLSTSFSYSLLPRSAAVGQPGLIAALEEHTGISLKSLWSIKYLGKIAPAAILGLLTLLFLSTSVYVVSPQQQAAVYRFGSFDRDSVADPGIHLKLPWPIDKVEYYDVQRSKSLQVGYNAAAAEDFFWTQAHDGEEYTLLLGGGTELVAVNMKLVYKIDDLYSYLSNVGSPEEVLTARAYEMLMNRTVTSTLDQILTVDRAGFAKEFTAEISEFCREAGLGLTVTETVIQSIHPPIQIADVYQDVINASLGKNSMIVNAHTAAEKALIEAEKAAKTAVLDAQTNQTKRISDAEYEMSVYYAAFEAWKADPESFLLHKYLTTFEQVVNGNKVYVFMPGTGEDLNGYVFGASGVLNGNSNSPVIDGEPAGEGAGENAAEGSVAE